MQPDHGIATLVGGSINWIDVCSLSLAFLYGIIKSAVSKQKLISRATGLNIANGIGLFPLVLLVLSTYWNAALVAVLQSNKVILSLAGVVALITILEDFLPPRSSRPISHPTQNSPVQSQPSPPTGT